MEKVNRLNPTWETRRQLFLLSMNKCAFPNCPHNIVDLTGNFIGEICHIEAANEGGERFNPNQTNENRREISNLILMCPVHHKVTNDTAIYTVDVMRNMKQSHEIKSFTNQQMLDSALSFIDSGFGELFIAPQNLEYLPLSDEERKSPTFFRDAIQLMQKISDLPRLTRSFYAHALLRSEIEEFRFDPRELQTRLSISTETIYHHAAILNRSGLLSEIDTDDSPQKVYYRFRTFDREDNQYFFLQFIYDCFAKKPQVLLDMIENINFIILEK